MPYCTQADLVAAFGDDELVQITDRTGAGVISQIILNAAITKADLDIDRRLRAKGWTVPLAVSSNDLRELSKDITRFYCYQVPTEVVTDAYNRAIKTLDDYVKGTIDLGLGNPASGNISQTEIAPNPAGISGSKGADNRIFTQSNLSDY